MQQGTQAGGEAPPKQVAVAMERLSEAGRLIADIRIGADRLLEAMFVAAHPHRSTKPLHFIVKEEASMRKHLQDLRIVGKQLEDSGVLSGSLRSRSNSWGLHMPLVCPDGAVVAYAWKRQLAGQAGASAVDRTRLALKAFTDQKRRFFPHLHAHSSSSGQIPTGDSSISKQLINAYQRFDWLEKASQLSSLPLDSFKEDDLRSSKRLRVGSFGSVTVAQAAVIELLVPSVFRAVVSLHPSGSVNPDAVAFFSPDEGGNYVHARGASVHHVFRHITEHAVKALQYFVSAKADMALYFLLHWICNYQNLFLKPCSKCRRLLTVDRPSALLLPPVHQPFRNYSASWVSSTQSTISTRNLSSSQPQAYHIGCSLEEA
ncbi:hypothetical protein Sjap_012105 [Stephania japonica]|uniref:Mediator of RNA polymerase II transcription subunit 27 n=1 Tax=Stephania japonica TaxID=461633 RepID=A0AAP0IVF6_9MAGN